MARELKRRNFKIKMPLVAVEGASIVIDGMDLTDQISSLTLHAAVGEVTELTITFRADVDVEGEALLRLLDHTGEELGEEDANETV